MSKLQKTTDYGKFKFMKGQRPIDLDCIESKTLLASMQKFGFLPAFPVMARPNGAPNKLEIVDGQHRYSVAKELGLPVYYVIDNSQIDVTLVNKAQRKWSPKDYAQSYANQGYHAYQTLLEYSANFGISIMQSAAFLSGTIHFKNISTRFHNGEFQIKNSNEATELGLAFRDIWKAAPRAKTTAFVVALYACWKVDYFNPEQLVSSIVRRPQSVNIGGGRADYLAAIEEAYNHGRKIRHPLKFDAEQTMLARHKTFGKSS